MANQILRPNGTGQYNNWTGTHTPLWTAISEADADGDASYVTASVPGAVTFFCGSIVGKAWPRATRISSIRVVATVRTVVASSSYRFRLRILDQDYDSDLKVVSTSVSYVEQDETYILTPAAYSWDLATLNRIEIGLVFVSGDEMRCTKMEVFAHFEPFPHHTLAPEANGILQQWAPNPVGSPAYMVVSGVFDGDLSYLENQVVNERSTFVTEDLPAILSPPNIDRVSIKGLVKNVHASIVEEADLVLFSGGVYFNGGTNTTSVPIPLDNQWHLLSEDYLNDPGAVWPSGDPAALAWSAAQINAIEIGVENAGGGDFRCTSLAAEVWLAPTPLTTINLFPTADGYHVDWSAVVPGAPAWGTVNEDPPDDITSYVLLDAATAGTPVYSSFAVGGAGVVPAGERIYNVEIRCRVRLGALPHSSVVVVPVMRTTGTPETYVGKPQLIEGTAGTWLDVKWDFHQNPHTGDPWLNLAEVTTAMQYGMGALSGAVLLSRVRAQVQTVQDFRGISDVTDLTITDVGEAWILRSKADGVIYGDWEFAVGIAGYDVMAPYTVVAVNSTDTILGNEVYRAPVDRIEYDATLASPTADYWCRVPRDEAQGGIGEIALFATVLWSPVPGEIGTRFMYCLAHMPCQTRTPDNVHFYRLQIQYHDLGPELLVDPDMETVGVAAWTATVTVLTKQTTDPYEGLQVLRSAKTGAPTGTASQAVLTVGNLYWLQTQGRSDGTSVPVIENPAGTAIWTGTTGTAWQTGSVLHIAAGDTSFWLGSTLGAATNYCEFDVASAREVLSFDFLTHGAELLVDGDQEAAGVVAWTVGNAAVLTKETVVPWDGLQVLRVTFGGVANPYAEQAVLVIGTMYRVRGVMRADGTGVPRVYDGAVLLWQGVAVDPDWQPFDLVFVATTTDIRFWCTIAGAGYCDVDAVSVKAVTPP